MIAFPAGAKVWIAGGATDMRKGMNTLALLVQQGLERDPHAGEIFCFRGKKADMVKLLWFDGVGMSLYMKRLEAGKFIWPSSGSGEAVQISTAHLTFRPPVWPDGPKRPGSRQLSGERCCRGACRPKTGLVLRRRGWFLRRR